MAHEITRHKIPSFAASDDIDYPKVAQNIAYLGLTFYCMNCRRKSSETVYVDGNVGPFCKDCMGTVQAYFMELLASAVKKVLTPESAASLIQALTQGLDNHEREHS